MEFFTLLKIATKAPPAGGYAPSEYAIAIREFISAIVKWFSRK